MKCFLRGILANPDTDVCIYRPMGEVFQKLTEYLTIFEKGAEND